MKINYDGIDIEMSDEFSSQDFTGQLITKELSGNIYGSCFSQELPETEVFPADMTGVTFYNCNLDNCVIPPGNNVVGGSVRRFKVQNDLRDWVIDGTNKPIEVVGKKHWEKLGYSVDPLDIPLQKIDAIDKIVKVG